MLLQQQAQWQYESQFQTYESFSQILHDVPLGPVYVSIIIAALPFLIYFLWKKSYLRTFIIVPVVTVFSRIWYAGKDRKLESRVNEEYDGIAGKKIELRDILRYGIYVLMVSVGFLTLKKAFFFGFVVSGSMMPTLMEADVVLIESMTVENIEVGDIIMFKAPSAYGNPVVHRVTGIEGGKIKTAGDNAGPDDWTITQEDIHGKVVTVNGRPVRLGSFIKIGPLELKGPGYYLTPREIYFQGSEPKYDFIREAIYWIQDRGPIILIVLLLIMLIGSLESRKKHKAMYD
ncbi:signal peptidase I [archaeon]|nr:signal peptidase I [archaeon]